MVHAADWIIHASAGGFIGSFVTPALAFLLGFVTHGILDIYVKEYMPYPFKKYWWWFLLQILVVTSILVLSPRNIFYGALGGIAPDVIDGIYGFFTKAGGGLNLPRERWLKKSRWNAGEMLFPFHRDGKGGSMSLLQNVALATVSFWLFLKSRCVQWKKREK